MPRVWELVGLSQFYVSTFNISTFLAWFGYAPAVRYNVNYYRLELNSRDNTLMKVAYR
jgi:hypothetical protein